ncbi:hypothetical protein BSF41_30530 [Flavobacterium sp. ACN2]|nr:hypothetical protein BSF41_30530 [Flavobacterium sp. ACN2]
MAYHFFSIKKNDVLILWTLMKRIYFVKTLIYTYYNYTNATSFVKVLNFDKAIEESKQEIRANPRLYEVNLFYQRSNFCL